jgi:hypothetical protein
MDREHAILLLKALVAAGAAYRTPMARSWIHDVAFRDLSLEGPHLASAIAYAEGEAWLADSPKQGWTSLTSKGLKVGQGLN